MEDQSSPASRIVLVSCVAKKRATPSLARDLYISALFTGMRSYAERNADRWFILSAMHGLVHPGDVISPYEQTLNRMRVRDRAEWSANVRDQLAQHLPQQASVVMLAGARYREGIVDFLLGRGLQVEIPMEGLRIGEQLRWLKEQNRHA